uniref:XK-related protein n=1 Tax=Schistosoma mansoni TaxID=6183 RepID=A0A3Q0KU44_SCHMA
MEYFFHLSMEYLVLACNVFLVYYKMRWPERRVYYLIITTVGCWNRHQLQSICHHGNDICVIM